MMRFKKGDRVQIADAATIRENSDKVGWNYDMLSMAGYVYTISKVDVEGVYFLNDCPWTWEDGMLIPYELKYDFDFDKILDFLEA
mgnify:FL=1